ncbi:MAG: PEP-CTERM sorting domain-containing protein [Chthoniobacterales bacterium]
MRYKACAVITVLFALIASGTAQTINDKSDMHPIIQLDFGPFGSHLPGDGQDYCYPTTATMLMFWLHEHGYTQIADTFNDTNALNLDRVLSGLMLTSATGGTLNSSYRSGLTDYLNAKGISDSLMTWDSIGNPDLDWFNSHNDDHSVVIGGLSWFRYDSTAGVYLQDGGHGTALVAADSGASTLTVNNPYPSTFYNVPNIPDSDPETVAISSIPGAGLMYVDSYGNIVQYENEHLTYIQVTTPILGGGNPDSLAVYDTGIALRLDDAAKPSNIGYSLSSWTLTTLKNLNTNGGTLTVLAPLAGAGGINKQGEGELQLQNSNSLTGDNFLTAGILSSTVQSGTPFGTGNVTVRSGTLSLQPDDTVPTDVSLTLASDAGNTLTVEGGATLSFARGANTSLALTIGGNTSGTTKNINFQNQGSLVISVATGLSELGNVVTVNTAGGLDNQPDVVNGMVTGNQVGQNNDSNLSGAFLTYDAVDGYKTATTTGGDINSATSTTIYQTSANQSIASTATVYALEVDSATVSGNTLSVGPQTSGNVAGIILNGGHITASTLSHGLSDAYVYTNSADGSISSAISGSGDFVNFGPGALTLSGNSAATQSGNIYVNTGILRVSGVTGTGAIEVRNAAALEVSGTVTGSVTVRTNSIAIMKGGTIQGGITVDAASTSAGSAVFGALQGYGTINGTSTISGSVQAGSTLGTLTFGGATTFNEGSQFFMTLASLVDNSSGTAGTDWNSLSFLDTVNFGNSSLSTPAALTMYLDLAESIDPDSGNAFWNSEHEWTFAIANSTDAFQYADFSIENWSWSSGNFSWHRENSKTELVLDFTPVPEPGSILLLLGGIATVAIVRRRALLR